MAGDLRTILEAVEARLVLYQPYVRCFIGASHLRDQGSAPRVVWVPGSETIVPHTDGRGVVDVTGGEQQVVAYRIVSVDAHLWGAKLDGSGHADPTASERDHLDATEQLLVDTIVAVNDTVWSYEVAPKSGEWSSEDGQVVKLGFSYRLGFAWKIAVPKLVGVGTVRVAAISASIT